MGNWKASCGSRFSVIWFWHQEVIILQITCLGTLVCQCWYADYHGRGVSEFPCMSCCSQGLDAVWHPTKNTDRYNIAVLNSLGSDDSWTDHNLNKIYLENFKMSTLHNYRHLSMLKSKTWLSTHLSAVLLWVYAELILFITIY